MTNDDSTLANQSLGFSEICEIARFVGVNEGEVEWWFWVQLSKGCSCWPNKDLHFICESSIRDVLAGDL